MKVCAWDLEGPLSFVDFAAEICKLLEPKLKRKRLGDFFNMVSNYDDYLIDYPNVVKELGIESYEPGDTLRLLAPFYIWYFKNDELMEISKARPGLNRGIKKAISSIKKNDWNVYVISTSYTQHAYNIGNLLGIEQDHIYCTNLNVDELKPQIKDINESINSLIDVIFAKYLKHNLKLEIVIDDLNNYFWKNKESDYVKVMNQVVVRGGKRKEHALEEISKRTNYPISKMIVTGDSITDKNMLERAGSDGAFAITWNGNEYSVPYANIAVTSPDSIGILAVFNAYPDIWEFIDKWEQRYPEFKDNPKKIPKDLVDSDIREYFIKNNFVPVINNLKNISPNEKEEIIKAQKIMRKKVRGWVGSLG
ncbi:MAG: HAD hydrolase family protein [Candidatus Hodarchaeota archaeon]